MIQGDVLRELVRHPRHTQGKEAAGLMAETRQREITALERELPEDGTANLVGGYDVVDV